MPLFEPFCGVRPCLPSGEDVLPFCENTMADLLRASKEERRTQYETMMQKGLCAKDPQPAFYLYEEKLTLDDGAEKRALGFLALSTASVMADPLRPAILLKSVLLPTLGRPTIATRGFAICFPHAGSFLRRPEGTAPLPRVFVLLYRFSALL